MPDTAGGASAASASYASLERSLERTIARLSGGEPSRETRALLIEARRLRSVIANWRSIPPPTAVRDEMVDRVLQLSSSVGAGEDDSLDEAHRPAAPTAPTADDGPQISREAAERTSYDNDDTEADALDFEPRLYTFDAGRKTLPRSSLTMQAVAPPARPAQQPHASLPSRTDARRTSPQPRPDFAGASPQPFPAQPSRADIARPPAALRGGATPPRRAPIPDDAPPARPPSDPPHDAPPKSLSVPPPSIAGASQAPPPLAVAAASAPVAAGVNAVPAAPRPLRGLAAALPPPEAEASPAAEPDAAQIVTYTYDAEGDDLSVPRTQIAAHATKLSDPPDPLLVPLVDPYSARADAYRAIRRKLASGTARVLGVTSASPQEGKTVFSVNLALTLREGARGRVLVVEANLRGPGMGKLFGFTTPACFMAQLARHAEDPRAPWVVAEPLPKLHVMAMDAATKHDPLLDPVTFGAGMERLKQAGYEYIIVDSPPVIGSVDCNVIADSVDAMILTALPLKSMRREMRKAVEQLEPAPILGVVVLEG